MTSVKSTFFTVLRSPYLPLLPLLWVIQSVVTKLGATLTNPDTFFHLAIGEKFATREWSIINPDTFSNYESEDWVPTQWLSQIVFHWLTDLGGIKLLGFVLGVVAALFLVSVYVQLSKLTNHWAAVGVLGLFAYGNFEFINARPMLFSFVFAAVMTFALYRGSLTGRVPYFLVGVQWLWVMVHGFWAVGLVNLVVISVAIGLTRGWRENKGFFYLPALTMLSTFLTPLGWRVWEAAFAVNSRAKGFFSEWAVPDFTDPYMRYSLILLFIAVVLVMRTEKANLYEIATVILALGWSVYSIRTLTIGLILLLPLIATKSGSYLPSTDTFKRVHWHGLLSGVFVVPLVLLGVTLGANASVIPSLGAEVESHLSSLPEGTTVYAPLSIAGLQLWTHPHLSQYFHGYADMYTDEEFGARNTVSMHMTGWQDYLADEANVNAIVVHRPQEIMLETLNADPRWDVTAESESYVVFERVSS